MKRDMDLARQILFEIEKLPHGYDVIFQPEIEGHSFEAVSYHIMLLTQAGYIEGEEAPDGWHAKEKSSCAFGSASATTSRNYAEAHS